MADTGFARYPTGSLDPRAQEFRPQNHHTVILVSSTPMFYPYVTSSPPYEQLPPPPHVTAASPVATRAVALSPVGLEASETSLRRELELFGEVRAVQMERLRSEAIVTVHFYDLRHAQAALTEIRRQHIVHQSRFRNHFFSVSPPFAVMTPSPGLLAGCAVWAQFVIPAVNAVTEGHNQGTLVIFNLDSDVSVQTLREIFQPFGAIKEFRETPAKKQQKFVEFFDVRDAARALRDMNGREINGKPLVIEFSRPGGQTRKFLVNAPKHNYQNNPAISPALHNPTRSATTSFHNPNRFLSVPPNLPPRKLSGFNHNNVTQRTQFSAVKKPTVTPKKLASPATTHQAAPLTKVNGVGARQKKSRHGKKMDSRFLISEEAISPEASGSCRDSRTTVMIKNIPNKYSQKLLLNMLDNHCLHCNERIVDDGEDQPFSSYDFVYLPIDFNNKCNVGYGFVNMTSPEATWRLYKAFHLQLWEAFNSRKICEVTYARVQGLEALKEHFKNSKFPCETEHYLPVVFSPPRDGCDQLTEPLPIVGQTASPVRSTPLTSSGCDEKSDGGDSSANTNEDKGDEGSINSCQNGGVASSDGNDDEDRFDV